MNTRLVHVGVRATDLMASLHFWRDALGLRVAATADGCCDLTDGRHNIRVFQHTGPTRPPHVSGLLDYLHIGVLVDDLAAAAQRCQDLGFPIIWDGVAAGHAYAPQHPPTESFKVTDPDGIVVDVTASSDQWPGVGI
ncbi:MAG TPA: VOC family protein [Chloroflexota bacterium]|nr:VOC family protein [Chloroflexota bacterium]